MIFECLKQSKNSRPPLQPRTPNSHPTYRRVNISVFPILDIVGDLVVVVVPSSSIQSSTLLKSFFITWLTYFVLPPLESPPDLLSSACRHSLSPLSSFLHPPLHRQASWCGTLPSHESTLRSKSHRVKLDSVSLHLKFFIGNLIVDMKLKI